VIKRKNIGHGDSESLLVTTRKRVGDTETKDEGSKGERPERGTETT
jgi:hypothetical protein